MYFQFDDIQFKGLFGPSAAGYRLVSRYGRTPLINGKEVVLHTGEQLDEYKLDFQLHFSFTDPQAALDRLNDKRERGVVCPLSDGTGLFIGNFFITALEVIETLRSPRGALVGLNLRMTLLEYAEIAANEPELQVAVDDAKAIAENAITPVRIDVLPLPPAQKLISDVTASRAEARASLAAANIAVTSPASAQAKPLARVRDGAKRAADKAREGIAVLEQAENIAAQVPLLLSQLGSLRDLGEALFRAAERGDVTQVSNLSRNLADAADSSVNLTRPLSRLAILRRL